ncbi:hypothetical protein D9M71_761950 [compost metagenome]
MDLQRRLDLPGEAFIDLHYYALLADFDQGGAKLMSGTIEQLQRIAFGHAQHSADVMGLGFRQLVLAGAQGGVDEETGQSHAGSLEKCESVESVSPSFASKPAPTVDSAYPVGAGLLAKTPARTPQNLNRAT